MSKKPKSYCTDLEPRKTSSNFSLSNIRSQAIFYVRRVIDLLLSFGVSALCLFYFYTTTTEKQLDQLTYISFLITCANAIFVTPLFRHESFCDLKLLMDYAQEVLPLPFLTADLWMKFEVAPGYVSYVHAAFGLTAFFFMVIFEYKRPDLTDLAMIFNFFSLLAFAIYMQNIFAGLAALEACAFYMKFKRLEQCFEKNKMLFMCSCAAFNLLALCSFDPDSWMSMLKSSE